MAIARGGIAVSGSYQASIKSLNVHLNQADSKSKTKSANFAVLFCGFLIHKSQLSLLVEMFKKILNAKWADIAARTMKGRGVLLPDVCARNLHLRKVPNYVDEQIVEV